MIRYLIKNNMKLMMRSFTNILLVIIMPIILIALLSSAFNDMMETYKGKNGIEAGYSIEDDKVQPEMIEAMKVAAQDSGITFYEYYNRKPENVIRNDKRSAFIVFKDGSYVIYQNGDMKEQAKIVEYFIVAFNERMMSAASDTTVSQSGVTVEHPEHMADISAQDYYGIIEIVYFGWCAIVVGAGVFASEKKYRIGKKLQVSNLSGVQMYLAKFVPMVAVVFAGLLISAGLSIVMFGVHWGNPLLSVLIIFISAAASTALGLMVYFIFDNIVITIISVFSFVWFAGFVGGSFETYMYSSHPVSLKLLSPIYHINRALVELSCMGHSDYVDNAIIYGVIITIVCSAAAVLASALRRRGKA
ncbi:MAG: ABC transporter permease [Eubacterium sp.]|nr:ABC transporter permease [Eubacterium sp.]